MYFGHVGSFCRGESICSYRSGQCGPVGCSMCLMGIVEVKFQWHNDSPEILWTLGISTSGTPICNM
jgi:hypothetical protein